MRIPRSPRITSGDIFEFKLPSGRFAYFQDIGVGAGFRLARFLQGPTDKSLRGEELDLLTASEAQYIAHYLAEVLLQQDDVEIVSSAPVPGEESRAPAMIVFDGNEDERDWLIRDANGTIVTGRDFAARHPTVRIDDLARNDDLPGPQLLAARLEAGWTPSNQTPIVYRPRPRTSYARPASVGPCTLYFVLFGTKADASAFGGALETSDDTEVDVPDYDQDGVWEVRIERRGYVDRAFEDELRRSAERFNGAYNSQIDIST